MTYNLDGAIKDSNHLDMKPQMKGMHHGHAQVLEDSTHFVLSMY